MPLRLVDCAGSHYAVGMEQGRLAKQAIHAAWEVFSNSQHLEMNRKARFALKGLYLIHCQQKAENFLKKMVKNALPEQHERIRGIAAGAELADKIIYLLHGMEMELMPKASSYALGSGIVIGIKPEGTTTGEPVLMKNFDYSLPFREMFLVRRTNPVAGCQTLDLALAFSCGTYAGINEHGLSVMYTFAYPTDSISIRTVPLSCVLQEVLETCYTTEEAVKLIGSYARDSGANILILDSSGDMRVVETSRTSLTQRTTENSFILATNHYISPEMTGKQVPLGSRWEDKALPRLRGKSIYKSSLERYSRAEKLLSRSKIDPDCVEEILLDHGDGRAGDDTICRHGPVFSTMASVIIYPLRRTIRIALGKPCEGKFEEFTMSRNKT